MEFWGVEVKAGESVTVDKMEVFGAKIHISQIALGEAKKGKSSEHVVLYLKARDQKFVLGTLNRENIPQISLDLYLDLEFELSHTSKDASVYFTGFREDDDSFEGSDDFNESDDDDDLPFTGEENGKPETETKAEKVKVTEPKKAIAGASAKQVKIVDPKKDEEDKSDDDSDDDSYDEDEGSSPDEMDADSDSDEESDSEDEEQTPTPVKKVVQGKKRRNESASKTPVSNKKAKNFTPEKADGKKNAHTATPHPMKKVGKSPNNSGAKGKTPNSGGQNRKAKHGAK